MDERIEKYLKVLEQQLAGLPEIELKEAMDYYTEYMNDALDEGVSPEELLSRLDSPEKTAAAVKAETSIKNVRSNPGLRSYSKLVKYSRIGFTRPLTILMFSLLIFTTYSIAITLFLVTIISVAAACLILPAFVYEALKIPSEYLAEIAGTIGMGIFFSGLMLLTASGFYALCRPIFRLSANLISIMMKKNTRREMSADTADYTDAAYAANADDPDRVAFNRVASNNLSSSRNYAVSPASDSTASKGKAKSSGKAFKAGLIIIAAGLLLTFATGLPVKLFMIFNSMKPSNITMHSREFTVSEVSKIDINTAHSVIRLKEGSSDNIELAYEKSDWLEFDISCDDGELVFKESSNGRMPLFPLVTMHENRAELTVTLPAGYHPELISLESRGGFLYIENLLVPVEAKTYTGSIFIETTDKPAAKEISGIVSARTLSGFIQVGGEKVGTKTANGSEYELADVSNDNIMLDTDRGNIFIKY